MKLHEKRAVFLRENKMPELRKIRGKVNLTLDIIGTQGEVHLIRSLFLKIPVETKGFSGGILDFFA